MEGTHMEACDAILPGLGKLALDDHIQIDGNRKNVMGEKMNAEVVLAG